MKHVALIIETSHQYGRDLLHGIREWVRENEQWSLRIVEHSRGKELPRWFNSWDGDGVIARVDSAKLSERLLATGLPVVDVAVEGRPSDFLQVIMDNKAVGELAFNYFHDKGFRSLAYCGDPDFSWSREREVAFARLTESHHLPYSVPPSKNLQKIGSDQEIRHLAQWIEGLTKPVGIFCCYDQRAQQILEACMNAGVRVPEEVAVLGTDNDEVLCDLCDPPLSSIDLNGRKTGYVAAELLNELMAGRKPVERKTLMQRISVIERQSTDLLAVTEQHVQSALKFIRQHACEGVNMKDVLRAVPMSRTLLYNRFKEIVGRTPHAELVKIKLDQARHLLLSSELSIAEIARASGFASPSYFIKVFHQETGKTPFAFQRKSSSEPV
jgi:LacI family transcriptional regulator